MNGRRVFPRILVLGVTTAAIVACQGPDVTPGTAVPGRPTAVSPQPASYVLGQGPHKMPTCGLTGMRLDSAVAQGLIPTTALSWATWEIPEFQDEQRFYDRQEGDYGPITCVVAAPHLERVAPDDFLKPEGVLVAVVVVSTPTSVDPISDAYGDLHLSVGYNCVVMRRESAAKEWEGYVVPAVERACQPIDPSLRLDVDEAVPYTSGALYPPVSRFVIKRNFRPAIGVRCLVGWCTIGAKPGEAREPAHGNTPSTHPNAVRRKSPGWFDDQELAADDPSKPTKLSPKHWASVIPDRFLESYDFVSDFDVRDTHVATIHFKGRATGKYRTAWGFTKAGADNEYELSLKRLTASPAETWEVRIDGKRRPNLKVIHTDHSAYGVHIFGTARWAWKDNDEGIWVRCEEGCCQVVAEPGT